MEVNSSQDATEKCLRLEERLRVLSEATRAFAEATTDSQRLLDTVARRIAEVVKDYCLVLLLSDDGQTLLPAAAFAPDPEALRQMREALLGPLLIEAHPVSRRVLESDEPFFVPRLDLEQLRPPRTTARYFDFVQRMGMHSLLFVALRVHDRSIGQLTLARYRQDSPPFDEHDLDLAQNLASHAALAISNAHLLVEAGRETAERKRMADRSRVLAESAHEFSAETYDYDRLLDVVARRLGEVVGDMCVIRAVTEDEEWLEPTGAVYHRDPELLAATRALLGYSRDEILSGSVSWKDLTPPEWRAVDTKAIEQLTTSGIGGLREKEYIRKDGKRRSRSDRFGQATAPNQIWTWDISKLATFVRGSFLNLYVILDLFSRYVVAWTVAERENSALVKQLFVEAILRYGIEPGKLLVHQDRAHR